jgi:hypothetical protein
LRAFSEQAKKMISAACKAKNIADADCKTPQIDTFESGINDTFQLTNPDTKKAVEPGAKEVNVQLYQFFQLQ